MGARAEGLAMRKGYRREVGCPEQASQYRKPRRCVQSLRRQK
jgi:hypothetical protein